MPKAEKGSLKDLGKKIKSKGLQKLKFYCQMCEKQCRDANGFKCHLTSESHLRQMKVFSESAGSFMDRYSKDFEKLYMGTLRMRHGTTRTSANNIYQEVIQDKGHIHMNATIWSTLTDFCKYLGKTGKCVVEETERGWYVTYIEQNVTRLQQQEATVRRLEMEQAAEQATHLRMEQQRIEAAKALDRAGGVLLNEATNMERHHGDNSSDAGVGTVQLAFNSKAIAKVKVHSKSKRSKSVFGDSEDELTVDDHHPATIADKPNLTSVDEPNRRDASQSNKRPLDPASRNANATETMAKQQRTTSAKSTIVGSSRTQEATNVIINGTNTSASSTNRDDIVDLPWVYRGILVRIITKEVSNGRYYRRKAIVNAALEDGFSAQVTVVDPNHDDDTNGRIDGDVLRLDQDDLETVAPKKLKERVRIVRGSNAGGKAIVLELDKANCMAVLELKDGTRLDGVDFDDFSLLA